MDQLEVILSRTRKLARDKQLEGRKFSDYRGHLSYFERTEEDNFS